MIESRLTLIDGDVGRATDGHKIGLWQCLCGNTARILVSRVRNGYTRSCGCLLKESKNLKHGRCNTPEYSSWRSMTARCLNQTDKDYPRYGGKGITVAEVWRKDFQAFFDHIGPRPFGTTIDRIDTRKGYEPNNVRWATPTQQANNTTAVYRVEINGNQFASMHDAARTLNVSVTTIIRWCDGYTDQRRINKQSGGVISPRQNCRRWKRYAD